MKLCFISYAQQQPRLSSDQVRRKTATALPGHLPHGTKPEEDHVIVLNEEGLRRVLASYIEYYDKSRLHLSLEKDSPDPRPVQPVGTIVAISEVGGLHHRYERRAA